MSDKKVVISVRVDSSLLKQAKRNLIQYDLTVPEYLRECLAWAANHPKDAVTCFKKYSNVK